MEWRRGAELIPSVFIDKDRRYFYDVIYLMVFVEHEIKLELNLQNTKLILSEILAPASCTYMAGITIPVYLPIIPLYTYIFLWLDRILII